MERGWTACRPVACISAFPSRRIDSDCRIRKLSRLISQIILLSYRVSQNQVLRRSCSCWVQQTDVSRRRLNIWHKKKLGMLVKQDDSRMNRRSFLAHSSMALATMAGTSLIGAGTYLSGQAAAEESVQVKTAYGKLRGKRTRDVITFKGVPYAGSVSGENRFKAPPPLEPWTGVRDAFTPGPPAFQPPRPSFGKEEPFPSEDCLVLNIWTPAVDQRRRPV